MTNVNSNSRKETFLWCITIIWLAASWAAVWVIDKSCEFLFINGRDSEEVVDRISRGTQRGMLNPGDSCQGWSKYDDLTLDSKMVATRVTVALSIVLGAFCLAVALAWRIFILRKCWKIAASFCAFCVAVFQATSHLMVKSDLCEGTNFVVEGSQIIYDQCDYSTPVYKLTFATIGMWLVASALLILLLPDREDKETSTSFSDRGDHQTQDEDIEEGANL